MNDPDHDWSSFSVAWTAQTETPPPSRVDGLRLRDGWARFRSLAQIGVGLGLILLALAAGLTATVAPMMATLMATFGAVGAASAYWSKPSRDMEILIASPTMALNLALARAKGRRRWAIAGLLTTAAAVPILFNLIWRGSGEEGNLRAASLILIFAASVFYGRHLRNARREIEMLRETHGRLNDV